MRTPKVVPENHPLRVLFRRLATRGMAQVGVSESSLVRYVSDLLVQFVHIDELYRVRDERGIPVEYLAEMVAHAERSSAIDRRDAYRHIGDYALFVLGFYPESLRGPARKKRGVDPDYYAEQGRVSYWRAAELGTGTPSAALLRELADRFEMCALGLHWVREYTHDPFYQYMLRQFRVT